MKVRNNKKAQDYFFVFILSRIFNIKLTKQVYSLENPEVDFRTINQSQTFLIYNLCLKKPQIFGKYHKRYILYNTFPLTN